MAVKGLNYFSSLIRCVVLCVRARVCAYVHAYVRAHAHARVCLCMGRGVVVVVVAAAAAAVAQYWPTDDDASSRPLKEDRRALPFPCLPAPRDRWRDVLRFVPVGSVFSFSTPHIFREASHLRCCFARQSVCLVVSLLSGMSRAVHPQEISKVDVDH